MSGNVFSEKFIFVWSDEKPSGAITPFFLNLDILRVAQKSELISRNVYVLTYVAFLRQDAHQHQMV